MTMPITALSCIPDINPPERLPLFIRFTILGAVNQTQKDGEPDWPGISQESNLEQSIVTKRPWGGGHRQIDKFSDRHKTQMETTLGYRARHPGSYLNLDNPLTSLNLALVPHLKN